MNLDPNRKFDTVLIINAISHTQVVFLTGDFNEPSHRDWTDAVAITGTHPLVCEWPTVKSLETEVRVCCVSSVCVCGVWCVKKSVRSDVFYYVLM